MRTGANPETAGRRRRRDRTGFLFLLPALLVVGLLLFYPVASSVYYSFTDKHLVKRGYEFVGLDNYIEIFSDPDFLHAGKPGHRVLYLGGTARAVHSADAVFDFLGQCSGHGKSLSQD